MNPYERIYNLLIETKTPLGVLKPGLGQSTTRATRFGNPGVTSRVIVRKTRGGERPEGQTHSGGEDVGSGRTTRPSTTTTDTGETKLTDTAVKRVEKKIGKKWVGGSRTRAVNPAARAQRPAPWGG